MKEFFQLIIDIKKNIQIHFSEMEFYNQSVSSEDMIFANSGWTSP